MSFSIKDAFTMDPAYDVGTYEAPSWTVDDNFFKYDPDTTGGIDWSTIYGNQDVLSDYGGDFDSDLFKKGLKFLNNYNEGSDDSRESQYYRSEKAKAGLSDDRDPRFQQLTDSVSQWYGGGYNPQLAAIQGAQSLAGMGGMPSMGVKDVVGAGIRMAGQQLANKALYAINPVLGAVNQFYPGGATEAFKDVTRFAGGIGNTISKGIGGVVKGIGSFFCDERLKVDIAPLESTEVNDELAQMAFFVKGIRECS
jgi:hypothetical protein